MNIIGRLIDMISHIFYRGNVYYCPVHGIYAGEFCPICKFKAQRTLNHYI